jgi:plastocyanin
MNKSVVIGIVLVILVVGGIYWFGQNKNIKNGEVNLPIPTYEPIPASSPVMVTIHNFSFSPSPITVKKGDTVVWTNKDLMAHTVTGNNGGPSSTPLRANGTYSFTFDATGVFNYRCSIHPSMKGVVVVTE